MKIISGTLKGRVIKEYQVNGTRPTMQRVKESLFSMIDQEVRSATFLDLFAGSGSIGFEAISRGAKEVTLVDNNPIIISNLNKNKQDFKINNVTIIKNDYQSFLDNTKKKFDIIYLDSPYNMVVINNIIDTIINNDLLTSNGLIICEMEANYELSYNKEITKINEKTYGKKIIVIYKKSN